MRRTSKYARIINSQTKVIKSTNRSCQEHQINEIYSYNYHSRFYLIYLYGSRHTLMRHQSLAQVSSYLEWRCSLHCLVSRQNPSLHSLTHLLTHSLTHFTHSLTIFFERAVSKSSCQVPLEANKDDRKNDEVVIKEAFGSCVML